MVLVIAVFADIIDVDIDDYPNPKIVTGHWYIDKDKLPRPVSCVLSSFYSPFPSPPFLSRITILGERDTGTLVVFPIDPHRLRVERPESGLVFSILGFLSSK